MLRPIKNAIRRGARTVALSSAASLLIGVGLAFLTVSAWMALAAVLEPVHVAAILGGAYMGVGLIVLAVALRSPDASHASDRHGAVGEGHAGPPLQTEALVQSFLTGMATGQTAAARQH